MAPRDQVRASRNTPRGIGLRAVRERPTASDGRPDGTRACRGGVGLGAPDVGGNDRLVCEVDASNASRSMIRSGRAERAGSRATRPGIRCCRHRRRRRRARPGDRHGSLRGPACPGSSDAGSTRARRSARRRTSRPARRPWWRNAAHVGRRTARRRRGGDLQQRSGRPIRGRHLCRALQTTAASRAAKNTILPPARIARHGRAQHCDAAAGVTVTDARRAPRAATHAPPQRRTSTRRRRRKRRAAAARQTSRATNAGRVRFSTRCAIRSLELAANLRDELEVTIDPVPAPETTPGPAGRGLPSARGGCVSFAGGVTRSSGRAGGPAPRAMRSRRESSARRRRDAGGAVASRIATFAPSAREVAASGAVRDSLPSASSTTDDAFAQPRRDPPTARASDRRSRNRHPGGDGAESAATLRLAVAEPGEAFPASAAHAPSTTERPPDQIAHRDDGSPKPASASARIPTERRESIRRRARLPWPTTSSVGPLQLAPRRGSATPRWLQQPSPAGKRAQSPCGSRRSEIQLDRNVTASATTRDRIDAGLEHERRRRRARIASTSA